MQTVNTNCQVWNERPSPGETVSWSGLCQGGKASGKGVAQWYENNNPGERYEGSYAEGKKHGYGVYRYTSGAFYEGEYQFDFREGFGTMTVPRPAYKEGVHSKRGQWVDDHYVLKGIFSRQSLVTACQSVLDCNASRAKIEDEKRAAEEQVRMFRSLGKCEVGESIYHREMVNTASSSGNALADMIWSSHTKAEYVIVYEAVVEGFLGNKVKATINGYSVKQLTKGSYVDGNDARTRVANVADKLVGKTQFYERSRCNNK